MEATKNENGLYDAYAWPGGYPIIYGYNTGEVVCPDCANKAKEDGYDDPDWCDVYYEGPAMYCEGCGKEIESAYGDPWAEESEAQA